MTLLEAKAGIDKEPRAATTHPSTLEMIVGLIDRFMEEGRIGSALLPILDKQAHFDELRVIADDPQKHKEFLLCTSLIASVRKAQSLE